MQGVYEKLCIQHGEWEGREKEELEEGFSFWNEKHPSLCTESRPASVLLAVP